MMRMGAFTSAVLVFALLATPVLARDFTDDEKNGLSDAIEKFDAAMKSADYGTVVDSSISPKLMEAMGKTYNVPADQLKTLVIQQMQQAMQTVKIDSYRMDLDNADYEETTDGTPYALVPSETVIEIGTAKTKSSAPTFAIIDDGKWYLLNVGQKQQADMVKSVDPSFADVTFPEAKTEPVQ
jgi:hypothetical protein